MLIVDTELLVVERELKDGRLVCPSCSSVLVPWGHGRPRVVRGEIGARLFLRPRRTRCSSCRITHVLLPALVLPRRADAVAVIGAGLEIAARGLGHRPIAERLGRPEATVRGWLRRFNLVAEQVRSLFTTVLVSVADDPVMPDPAAGRLADAVAAVLAAAAVVEGRFVVALSPWELACRTSRGTLLAPSAPPT